MKMRTTKTVGVRVLCAALMASTGSVGTLGTLGALSTSAIAAPPKPQDERPWAKGVPKEKQENAIKLFGEGTDLFKNSFFVRAVEKYRQALKDWDHPAIHFNLAKALMNLDQAVEAYTHFEHSMRFGGPPLDANQIEQVKTFKKQLYDKELAEVVITCQEPDAQVALNGEPIFKAPGKWQGVVKPGNVTVIATKEGFQTATSKPNLKTGQKNDLSLTLLPLDQSVTYERPFSQAIPWTVTGVGIALAGGGALMGLQASSGYKEFDDAIEACNAEGSENIIGYQGTVLGTKSKCVPTAAIKDKKSSAELMETLSLVGYIAGGTAIATGIVLFIVNRERPVTTYEESVVPVSILPYIGPDGAGVSATIGF